MRKLIGTSLIAACCLAVPLLTASPAQAGLEACGNINVEASAQCKVEVAVSYTHLTLPTIYSV